MIGPHQGRELELMLSGAKHLAMFHDIPPDNGNISEEIIPEQTFAPFVAEKILQRFEKDIHSQSGDIIHYVCFTTSSQD